MTLYYFNKEKSYTGITLKYSEAFIKQRPMYVCNSIYKNSTKQFNKFIERHINCEIKAKCDSTTIALFNKMYDNNIPEFVSTIDSIPDIIDFEITAYKKKWRT